MALVKIGVTALRGPDGNFLPSVPLYADIPDKEIQPSGMTKTEEKNMQDITSIFYEKFKTYIERCKDIGIDMEEYLR